MFPFFFRNRNWSHPKFCFTGVIRKTLNYFSTVLHILVGLLRALQTLTHFPPFCNPLAGLCTTLLPVCFQGKVVSVSSPHCPLTPHLPPPLFFFPFFFFPPDKPCNGFKLPIKICSQVCIRWTKHSFPSHCPFASTKCYYAYSLTPRYNFNSLELMSYYDCIILHSESGLSSIVFLTNLGSLILIFMLNRISASDRPF